MKIIFCSTSKITKINNDLCINWVQYTAGLRTLDAKTLIPWSCLFNNQQLYKWYVTKTTKYPPETAVFTQHAFLPGIQIYRTVIPCSWPGHF